MVLIAGVDSEGKPLPVRVNSVGYPLVGVQAFFPDGTNLMPSGDATARPIYTKLTDGTNDAVIDTDDGSVAGAQNTLVVICLNYVWDTDHWARMTQP